MFQETFNDTKVTISGLNAVTTYRFRVIAENGVSGQITEAERQFDEIIVTTEASVPSSVSNVKVSQSRPTELVLKWDAPDDAYEVDMYEVRFFVRGMESNASSLLTKKEESTFTALKPRTDYGFQVRAKTTHGWGDFSPPVFKMTGQVLGKSIF